MPAEVADPLRSCFPEALLLRCLSIPSHLISVHGSKANIHSGRNPFLMRTFSNYRSVSVPSVGVEDDLLISLGNFLETGFPKVTLAALRTSAAGKCYTTNTPVECPHTAEQPGPEARCAQNPPCCCSCLST